MIELLQFNDFYRNLAMNFEGRDNVSATKQSNIPVTAMFEPRSMLVKYDFENNHRPYMMFTGLVKNITSDDPRFIADAKFEKDTVVYTRYDFSDDEISRLAEYGFFNKNYELPIFDNSFEVYCNMNAVFMTGFTNNKGENIPVIFAEIAMDKDYGMILINEDVLGYSFVDKFKQLENKDMQADFDEKSKEEYNTVLDDMNKQLEGTQPVSDTMVDDVEMDDIDTITSDPSMANVINAQKQEDMKDSEIAMRMGKKFVEQEEQEREEEEKEEQKEEEKKQEEEKQETTRVAQQVNPNPNGLYKPAETTTEAHEPEDTDSEEDELGG